MHKDIELARCTAEKLSQIQPINSSNLVLLSNMCVAIGRWDEVEKLRASLKESRVTRQARCSGIEDKHQLVAFLSGVDA